MQNVHVDAMHLTPTTCAPPPQLPSSEESKCGGPVHVPCAAQRLLTSAPSSATAAAAGVPGPLRSGASDAAAHVRRLERAMSATPGPHHGATPCPGTHQIFVIVGGGDSCGNGEQACPHGRQGGPSAWVSAGRTSYVWLGGGDVVSGAREGAGAVIRVITHGVHVSDVRSGQRQAGRGEDAANAAGAPRKPPLSAASELSAVFTMAVAEPEPGNIPGVIGEDVEVCLWTT